MVFQFSSLTTKYVHQRIYQRKHVEKSVFDSICNYKIQMYDAYFQKSSPVFWMLSVVNKVKNTRQSFVPQGFWLLLEVITGIILGKKEQN